MCLSYTINLELDHHSFIQSDNYLIVTAKSDGVGTCMTTFQPMWPESSVNVKDFPCWVCVWQACQRGDPLSLLKKQLEEKDKLLTTQQEDAANDKKRLRELSKVSQTAFRSSVMWSLQDCWCVKVTTIPPNKKMWQDTLKYVVLLKVHWDTTSL